MRQKIPDPLARRCRSIPAPIVLFGVGAVLSVVRMFDKYGSLSDAMTEARERQTPSYWFPISFDVFSSVHQDSVLKGALGAGIQQVPLTCLNSVISVALLTQHLFPKGKRARTSPKEESTKGTLAQLQRKFAFSICLMNLTTLWFGGVPVCHGAGGLASQYAWGARTGWSNVFLGAFKVCLAVVLGNQLCYLVLESFPRFNYYPM